jgi:hypothetical protein
MSDRAVGVCGGVSRGEELCSSFLRMTETQKTIQIIIYIKEKMS